MARDLRKEKGEDLSAKKGLRKKGGKGSQQGGKGEDLGKKGLRGERGEKIFGGMGGKEDLKRERGENILGRKREKI